jgi:quinol-cytochrome oxidoreductase complex cytochrome b subunit
MTDDPTIPRAMTQKLRRRIWRSIFRGPLVPGDDRERKWVTFNNFVLHFRPVRVPVKTLSYTHTFGLGGMALVLFLLLVGTGVLLMFAYEPAPGDAYESILRLQEATAFGAFVRSVHHWSANLLIVVVVLHMLRVFFTGAFHAPRQFNWVLGLGLLACVVSSNFTGYLLPWDQLSYWAITISTGMLGYLPLGGGWLQNTIRGGEGIGQATLITFYALHTTVIPVSILVLMGFHFWRVRKAKGVVIPRNPGEILDPQPEKVLGLPFLFLREFVVALILVAVVLLFSAIVSAPLGEAANPGMSPNPAKAPWYFMGFQELLLHFHPVFAVFLIPTLGVVFLVMVAYLRYDDDSSGIWFVSKRGRTLALRASVTAVAVTSSLVIIDEWILDLPLMLPWLPALVVNGMLPVGVLALAGWVGYRWLRTGVGATRNESVQTAFVLLGVAFAVLTAIGIWFRGPGMALGWVG